MKKGTKSYWTTILLIPFLIFSFLKSNYFAQGLPTSGTAKLLIIYSDVKDSSTFDFNPDDLSNMLKDFYSQMSLGKLNLEITNQIIAIEKPENFSSHLEAIVFLLEQAEAKLDLSEYSQYAEKNVLDGICIIFDDFYASWEKNPNWSGIASINLKSFSQKFDNMSIQQPTKYEKSSGLIMRCPNDLNYSFWVLAHEVGHLFGLSHFPENIQLPYYQLMNSSGSYWGINRGMSFWEREQLGWIEPITDIELQHLSSGTDTVSFYLQDYMTTGEYAKITLPGNDYAQNGKIVTNKKRALYFENRSKISEFDQDKHSGDEGIFIWDGPGKLVAADDEYDFSIFPTNDAFGAPNFTSSYHQFNYRYNKIDNLTLNEGYDKREYVISVNIKIDKDNKITIVYGKADVEDHKFVITAKNKDNKILLRENYPNPFNPTTQISFRLYKWGKVRLDIFDSIGKKVATLVDRTLNPGDYSYTFDASNLSSGTYLYRIMMPGSSWNKPFYEIHSGKMLYIK